jgi:hypothetical protein
VLYTVSHSEHFGGVIDPWSPNPSKVFFGDRAVSLTAAAEEPGGKKREVALQEGESPQMKLKVAQAKLLGRKKPRIEEAEEDLAAVGSRSAPEAAPEEMRPENSGNRPLLEIESSEVSSSSEVDLVQEAVNPGSKSYNIPHLKVSGSISCSV